MKNRIYARLLKKANEVAVNKVKKMIDDGEITKKTIINGFDSQIDFWRNSFVEQYEWSSKDDDFEIPDKTDLVDEFMSNYNAKELFDSIFDGELESETFNNLDLNDKQEILDFAINKFDIKNDFNFLGNFEEIADDIAERFSEGPDPDNKPWGPGMSMQDFI